MREILTIGKYIAFDQSLFDAVKQKTEIGPEQGLKELEKIKAQLTAQEVGDLNSILQLCTPQQKADALSGHDFKTTPNAAQVAFFEGVRSQNVEWPKLVLRNASALTNDWIINKFVISYLQKLVLSGCADITDDVLLAISKDCPGLRHLDISGIKRIKMIALPQEHQETFVRNGMAIILYECVVALIDMYNTLVKKRGGGAAFKNLLPRERFRL